MSLDTDLPQVNIDLLERVRAGVLGESQHEHISRGTNLKCVQFQVGDQEYLRFGYLSAHSDIVRMFIQELGNTGHIDEAEIERIWAENDFAAEHSAYKAIGMGRTRDVDYENRSTALGGFSDTYDTPPIRDLSRITQTEPWTFSVF